MLRVGDVKWVLKGGLALQLQLSTPSRPPGELGLVEFEAEDAVASWFSSDARPVMDDHFEFTIGKTRHQPHRAAMRYSASCTLDGEPFGSMGINLESNFPDVARPELVKAPALLAFAGIDPVQVPVVPLDLQLAECLYAYTRDYIQGHYSGRSVEFAEIILICSRRGFAAGRLRAAFDAMFAARPTHGVPVALMPPPPEWGEEPDPMDGEARQEPSLAGDHATASAFLDPVLSDDIPDSAIWNPATSRWRIQI